MNELVELAVFGGVIVLGQFSPGPDMLLLTRTALAQGGRAGAWTATGIACGLVVHAAVAMSGASLLLAGASLLARCLRAAAAVYLGWIALQLLRAACRPGHGLESGPVVIRTGAAGIFWRRGFFCNVFNPKVALFLAAVAAPFLTSGHSRWWPLLLAAVIVGEGLVLWIAWAWALQWPPLRRGYRSASRWIDAFFGCALAALVARLLGGLF
ncbi:MAG: LysE family transporter [Verrucomicrobiota bacterium]